MSKLTEVWKTSSPEILTPEKSLLFLGTRLSMTPLGFELKQVEYAKQVVSTFKEELGANRVRTTPADPDGFAQKYCTLPAQPPTPTQKQLKIIGALLWLSTRSRPDISFGVSKLASVLNSNYQEARLRARHLIQYLAGSLDLGVSIEFMGDAHSTLPVKPGLRIFTDASSQLCPLRRCFSYWNHCFNHRTEWEASGCVLELEQAKGDCFKELFRS
eukprot:3099278-Amphidinium_carterae.5